MKRTRQTRIGFLALGLSLMLSGCGGRVIDDSGAGAPAPSGTTGSSGAAGKAGSSGRTTTFPSMQLGECVPGFSRAQNPGRPCRWLTESGLCFDTTQAACACICPVDRESVCAHGFEGGPNDAKLVLCD